MSYREALVFIRHLPADSWTQTVIRDERLEELAELVNPAPEPAQLKFGPWSLLNHQVAVLTDAVNELTHVTKISTGLDRQGPRPELTPRPVPRRRSTTKQSPEAVAYLAKLRAPRSLTAG